MTTLRNVLELCPQVAQAACDLYHRQLAPSGTVGRHLVHPYKGVTLRCSEQETRIIFCQALEAAGFWYSLETPTYWRYKQSGEGSTRARSDIAVYSDIPSVEKSLPSVRIELKAYGGKIAEEDLRKDLEKLVRENVDGILFHTSPTADKRTLPRVIQKIANAFDQLATAGYLTSRKHTIAIALCVLKRRELWICQLRLDVAGEIGRVLSTALDMNASKDAAWTYHHLGVPVQVSNV